MSYEKWTPKVYLHPNVLGAGARKRKGLAPMDKVKTVMGEFKRGTLHGGGGGIVGNRKQAIAIALSEAGKHGQKVKRKKHKVHPMVAALRK